MKYRWFMRGPERDVRWALFKMRWFPYRTYELLGFTDEGDAVFGPAVWNRPDVLR